MFRDCNSLVGGNGTTYDADHIDATYARPDGEDGKPGYFFKKQTEVYTAFNETTGVLTYYYDDQRAAHRAAGEITEVYDPVNNLYALRFTDYHEQVTKAVIHESMKDAELTSMFRMFYGGYYGPDNINNTLTNMTEIVGLENLVTDKVVNMEYLFWGCSKLASLDLSSFNTAKVTDMRQMFYNCSSLTSLDLSHFNTTNVRNMSDMFHDCLSLTSLNVTSFNTSNVETMHNMFTSCKSLTSVDLSSFNTAKVTDMSCMFYGSALTSLDLSSFNTANVTDMSLMFYVCGSLSSLDVSHFNTDNVTTMRCMFRSCSSLTSLDLSSFNTDKVTSMEEMFYHCSALKTILCNDDWSKSEVLTNSNNMFRDCNSLVGGMGTIYDANHTDIEYAHPDGEDGNPGYFTRKNLTLSDQMTAIAISDFIDANNGQTMPEITIQRDVYGNYYNTLCLPFDMNAAQIASSSLAGAEIKAFTGATVDNDVLHLSLTRVNSIQAGKPYFIKYSNPETLSLLNFINVTVSAGEPAGVTYNGVTLQGTYTGFAMPAQTEESHSYLFLGQNNVLFWPSVSGRIKPFRAYFIVQTGSIHGAPHRGMPAVFDEVETATGMDEVQGDNGQRTKVIENGVLYLKYNGRKYDAQGHFVK